VHPTAGEQNGFEPAVGHQREHPAIPGVGSSDAQALVRNENGLLALREHRPWQIRPAST